METTNTISNPDDRCTAKLQIRWQPELAEEIKAIAKRERLAQADIIRKVLWMYVEQQRRKTQ